MKKSVLFGIVGIVLAGIAFGGILNPNPTEALDVNGNIKLTGDILSDGSSVAPSFFVGSATTDRWFDDVSNIATYNIGRNVENIPVDYWDGSIDDFVLFERALSPTEISDLYNNGAGLSNFTMTEVFEE